MNTLSWMIYAAEVLSNVKVLLGLSIAASALGLGMWTFIAALMCGDNDLPAGSWKKPIKLMWIPFVLGLFVSLTPSAQTIYMIAASEAGETIVTSPEARDMFNDLKSLIQKKLKDELGDIKT